jgi:tetratricopeptide (TPR) repeat protein
MQMLEPVLTAETLRSTLEKLSRGESLPDDPLSGFALVWSRFNHPDIPRNDVTLQHIIYDVLEEAVVSAFAELRTNHARPAPDYNATYEEALVDLSADASVDNDLLFGGSIVFHQYLRPDLSFSTEIIAESVHISARSVRRYRNRFITHVQRRLIADELAFRRQYRRDMVTLQLPIRGCVQFETQQSVLRYVFSVLSDYAQTQPTLLFGPAASGKSTIALQLAHTLVETNQFFDALWLDLRDTSISNAEELCILLVEKLQLYPIAENQSHLQLFQHYVALQTATQRLLIILDNADHCLASIMASWQWLSHVTLIVTARARPTDWPGIEQQPTPLSQTETKKLLRFLHQRLFPRQPIDDIAAQSIHFWKEFSGNVGHIQRAYQRQFEIPPTQHTRLSQLAATIGFAEQQVLLLIQLIGKSQLVTYTLLHVKTSEILEIAELELQAIIVRLADHQLIYIEHDPTDYIYRSRETNFSCTDEARTRLVRAIIDAQDQQLCLSVFDSHNLQPQLVQQLAQCIPLAHDHVLHNGHWHDWQFCMEQLLAYTELSIADEVLIQTELAVINRWRGNFRDAERHLRLAQQYLQSETLPVLEANVLLEQTILRHYQHQPADTPAQQALALYEQHGTLQQIDMARTVLARTIHKQHPDKAYDVMQAITTRDGTYWSLLAHINLQREQYHEAHEAARACVARLHPSDTRYARGLALLARTYVLLNESENARHTYENALNHAQHSQDIVALSRLYFNFAYFLFTTGQHHEARKYMLRAVEIQESLQDTVALHNALAVLHLIDEQLQH